VNFDCSAILFDLDGVLVDSTRSVARQWRLWAEENNIDPEKGLFFGVNPAKRIGEWNNSVRRNEASYHPPSNTRAAGRARQ